MASRDREATTKALRPVTVRQMLEAKRLHSQAKFTIDGYAIYAITTVAHLVQINRHEVYTDYILEDGGSRPGRIIGRQSNDRTVTLHDVQDYAGSMYARVLGTLDQRFEKNCIKIHSIRQVTDPHEVQYHFLQAMFATRYLEVGPHVEASSSAPPKRVSSPNPPPPEELHTVSAVETEDMALVQSVGDMELCDCESDEGENTSNGDAVQPDSHNVVEFTPLQRGIIYQLQMCQQTDDGVDVTAIARGISHLNITAEEVEQALDFLMDGAYIYATIDPSHYKLTKKGASTINN